MDNEKAVVRLPLLNDRSKELDLLPLDSNEVGSLIHYKMDNVVHKLPHPQSLKPYMDTKTADIDMWPSHASNQNSGHTMTKLTRSNSLQLINAESLGKPNFIPQPKLLENLEGYLKDQLAFIDESVEENGNISLEVYRRTFNHLINKLKTYKNLLSRIKIQYEMALDDLENQIKSLQPFKEKIVATAESYEQKIMAFNEKEKPDIKAVQEQNSKLEEEIEIMEEKLVYIENERQVTEEKLKEAYQFFRNEYDAQKLLDIEYKELEILHSNTQYSTDSSKPTIADNDLTTLKITLSQSIKDADATQAKLDQMIASYSDVVPRRQYETLEKKYIEMKESNEVSLNDLNILKAEHKALKEVIEQLNEELTSYNNECISKKKSLPRTPWEKPCHFINPESNYFEGISSANSCEHLLNILRDMDKNGAKILKRDYVHFDGKGLGENVPKYLRYEGQVYNRQFNKRDCALLIKDIWRKRINFKKSGSFTDFIDNYLKQNFPTPLMKTEWAYNLVDACKRFAENNKNIELFWLILNGEMDENVYHCQLAVITDLMKSLEDSRVSVMKSAQFQEHLQKFLNPNDSKITASLVKVALQELESEDEINFGQLFLEDDEGEVGPFLTEFKNWLQSLRIEFCNLVSQELDENSPVSIQSLDLAIRQTDPTLKTNSVKELLCWCYATTPDVLLKSKPLPVNEVLSRLRNAGIRFSNIKTYF